MPTRPVVRSHRCAIMQFCKTYISVSTSHIDSILLIEAFADPSGLVFDYFALGSLFDGKYPPGRRILPTRWVFTIKKGAQGEIIKYKARWVCKGFYQEIQGNPGLGKTVLAEFLCRQLCNTADNPSAHRQEWASHACRTLPRPGQIFAYFFDMNNSTRNGGLSVL